MKRNAMIVGLAAAILLTLDGGALVRVAAEPTRDTARDSPTPSW